MKFGALLVGVLLASAALAAGGCSSKEKDGSGVTGLGSNGSGSNGSGSNGSGSNGSGGAGANGAGANGSGAASTGNTGGSQLLVPDGGVTDPPPGTGGPPEVCDGVDNDNNGVIDDVDQNGDGVCDCLRIATLGVKGTWGSGDVFATWLSARSDAGAVDLADQVLSPELLAHYQVIVAQDVHKNHQYADAEVAALQDWVNKGGGFMTLIGYADSSEIVNVNRLLVPFAMHYGSQAILQKGGGNPTVPITTWTPHPIDAGVTAVGVDSGYEAQGMGDAIATARGFTVGRAQSVGAGHVFVWGDEWITYDSEWTDHPDYQLQLFWLNSIKWLTVASQCQVAIPPDAPT